MSDLVESEIAQRIRAAARERMVKANALSEAYLSNMQALDQAYDEAIRALYDQARQQGIAEERWQALVRQVTVPPRL